MKERHFIFFSPPILYSHTTVYVYCVLSCWYRVQWYAPPIKIIGIKIIVPKKSEKSLRLMVHISKPLTNH